MSDLPLVVRAPEELDAVSAPALRDELAVLLSQGAEWIVVDMGEVRFLDSSGIGALVAAHRVAAARGARVSLRALPATVAATLRVAGLANHFEVLP